MPAFIIHVLMYSSTLPKERCTGGKRCNIEIQLLPIILWLCHHELNDGMPLKSMEFYVCIINRKGNPIYGKINGN